MQIVWERPKQTHIFDRWLKGFDHFWLAAWLAKTVNQNSGISQSSARPGLDAANVDVIR